MSSKLVMAAALLAVGTSAFAFDQANIDKILPLQDGTSVYIFKDGKMAMEDRLGRSVSMAEGRVMRTRDGQTVAMVGNETARLDSIRKTTLGGGR